MTPEQEKTRHVSPDSTAVSSSAHQLFDSKTSQSIQHKAPNDCGTLNSSTSRPVTNSLSHSSSSSKKPMTYKSQNTSVQSSKSITNQFAGGFVDEGSENQSQKDANTRMDNLKTKPVNRHQHESFHDINSVVQSNSIHAKRPALQKTKDVLPRSSSKAINGEIEPNQHFLGSTISQSFPELHTISSPPKFNSSQSKNEASVSLSSHNGLITPISHKKPKKIRTVHDDDGSHRSLTNLSLNTSSLQQAKIIKVGCSGTKSKITKSRGSSKRIEKASDKPIIISLENYGTGTDRLTTPTPKNSTKRHGVRPLLNPDSSGSSTLSTTSSSDFGINIIPSQTTQPTRSEPGLSHLSEYLVSTKPEISKYLLPTISSSIKNRNLHNYNLHTVNNYPSGLSPSPTVAHFWVPPSTHVSPSSLKTKKRRLSKFREKGLASFIRASTEAFQALNDKMCSDEKKLQQNQEPLGLSDDHSSSHIVDSDDDLGFSKWDIPQRAKKKKEADDTVAPIWKEYTINKAIRMNDRVWRVWLDKDPYSEYLETQNKLFDIEKLDDSKTNHNTPKAENAYGFEVLLVKSGNISPIALEGQLDKTKDENDKISNNDDSKTGWWQDGDENMTSQDREMLQGLRDAVEEISVKTATSCVRIEISNFVELGRVKSFMRWDVMI